MNESGRLLFVSTLTDGALGVGKILVGWLANSHALIADGIHSLSDLATDLMVWGLNHVGIQAPDDDHPYGHARFETLGALILGAILILVAATIVYDSVTRLEDSITLPTWPALVAALASILAKEWLFQWTRRVAKRINSRLLHANAWHHRSDSISSVIVLVGVGGAMMGIAWLEMVAAIGVALMIAMIGWRLIRDSGLELVDTAIDDHDVTALQSTVEGIAEVQGIHSLRTRRMGADVILDIHLQVPSRLSVSEGHHIGDRVVDAIKANHDEVRDVTVHIDTVPDQEIENTTLPIRESLQSLLFDDWQGVLAESDVAGFTLHYLPDVVDIELFLENPVADKAALKDQLTALANHRPWFGRLTVWQ